MGERPPRVHAAEPNRPPEFDSALLTVNKAEPADWRPAYCVLALALEACPGVAHTHNAVPNTTTSSASIVGLSVNPHGLPTTYRVEYGTTAQYGQTTSAMSVTNNIGEQSETIDLSGLTPCTTYHYQAEAENEANNGVPSLGGDQTFKTRGCFEPATAVTGGERHTCAQLRSKVANHGMIMLYTDQPAISYWQALMTPDQRNGTVWRPCAHGSEACDEVQAKPDGLLASLIRRLVMIPDPGLARKINLENARIMKALMDRDPDLAARIADTPGPTLGLAEQIFIATKDPKTHKIGGCPVARRSL